MSAEKAKCTTVVPGSQRSYSKCERGNERQRENIIISSLSCRTIAVEGGREKMREEDGAKEEDRTKDRSNGG